MGDQAETRDMRQKYQDLYLSRIAADEQAKRDRIAADEKAKRDQKALEFASNLQMQQALKVKQLELKLADASAEELEPLNAEYEAAVKNLSDTQSRIATAQAKAGKTDDEAKKSLQAKLNEYKTVSEARKELYDPTKAALKDAKFADNYLAHLTGTTGSLGYTLGSNIGTPLYEAAHGVLAGVMGSPITAETDLAVASMGIPGEGTKQIERNALAAASMWSNGALTKLPLFEGALGNQYFKDIGQRAHAADVFTTDTISDMFSRAIAQTGQGRPDAAKNVIAELVSTLHGIRDGGDVNTQTSQVRALAEKAATQIYGSPNQAATVVDLLSDVLESASTLGQRPEMVEALAKSGKAVTPQTLQAAALGHLSDSSNKLRGRLKAITRYQFPTFQDLTELQSVYQKAIDAGSPEVLTQTLQAMTSPLGAYARKDMGPLEQILAASRRGKEDVLKMQSEALDMERLVEQAKARQPRAAAAAKRRAGKRQLDILEQMSKSMPR
jgi:hypothetical protein